MERDNADQLKDEVNTALIRQTDLSDIEDPLERQAINRLDTSNVILNALERETELDPRTLLRLLAERFERRGIEQEGEFTEAIRMGIEKSGERFEQTLREEMNRYLESNRG